MIVRKNNEMMSLMESLYETFYQRLFLYALTFLDNEDEAKDAVGEVFSKVWNQWEKNGQAEKVTQSFLYRLTRNKCLDILRHDKARRNYAAFVSYMPSFENEDEVIHYENRISELKEAIDRLPEPGNHPSLLLFQAHDLSAGGRAIAADLGCHQEKHVESV